MGSSRLPGKVIKPLAGRPMIERIVERLRRMKSAQELVLATSLEEKEAPLLREAERLKVTVFRGSHNDVLDRYYRCAQAHGFRSVIRATADNPLVDPEEGDRLAEFFGAGDFDYACEFPEFGSGLPDGVGLEIFSFAALEKSWEKATAPADREHVNEYIQQRPAEFKVCLLKAPALKYAPGLRLTVDTPEDFERMRLIYEEHERRHPGELVPVAWAIAWLKQGVSKEKK